MSHDPNPASTVGHFAPPFEGDGRQCARDREASSTDDQDGSDSLAFPICYIKDCNLISWHFRVQAHAHSLRCPNFFSYAKAMEQPN